jgi:hypothetical protein
MKLSISCFATALVAAILSVPATPAPAAAHVCMDFPISRVGTECTARSPQKIGSCPVAGRSEHVNVFRPGETIMVRLRETINHPSHYRIAFNPDGDSFPDPVAIDDINDEHQHVVVDGIEDAEEAIQEVEVTFPRTECENCTLQLIQVMYDKQGNGFGGANGGPNDNDDLYYSCADIALRGEPVPVASTELPNEPQRAGFAGWIAIAALGLVGMSIGGVRRISGR